MEVFLWIVALLFSVIIHEIAHGYVAYLRGDDTAKRAGRLTLNPIPHIDLYGSIILPVLCYVAHLPFMFGYAKPVPVRFSNLKNPAIDIPLVSAAGPVSNIFLAIIAGLAFRIVMSFSPAEGSVLASVIIFLQIAIILNVVLFILNLIPIPPLDGSKIAASFMPNNIAMKYMRINPFIGMAAIIGLFFLFGRSFFTPVVLAVAKLICGV